MIPIVLLINSNDFRCVPLFLHFFYTCQWKFIIFLKKKILVWFNFIGLMSTTVKVLMIFGFCAHTILSPMFGKHNARLCYWILWQCANLTSQFDRCNWIWQALQFGFLYNNFAFGFQCGILFFVFFCFIFQVNCDWNRSCGIRYYRQINRQWQEWVFRKKNKRQFLISMCVYLRHSNINK